MIADSHRLSIVRVLPDVAALSASLGIAYLFDWEVKDLVWSLWLGSLVLGYLTVLSAIAAGAYVGLQMIRHKEFKKQHRIPAIIIGTAIGLFLLGFFSLHFCAFHAVHSVFLQHFFPVEGMPRDGFGQAFMNPPLLWLLVFRHLVAPYGLFLVAAIIAERNHVFRPLIATVQAVRMERASDVPPEDVARGCPGKKGSSVGDVMTRPYANVIRMHLLIFFFAFCHAMSADSFLVYAVVYLVYLFPWREVRQARSSPKTEADGASTCA